MRRIAFVILMLVGGLEIAIAQGKVLSIPLRWMPKESPDIPAVDLTGVTASIKVDRIADKREDVSAIGENPEKRPPVRVVTTADIAGFLSEHLASELTNLGFSVGGSESDRNLRGDLLQFWVRDTGSYDCTIRVKFTVRDAAGAELWAGTVTGRGGNWGRQLKADNYNETISDAVLDLIANLARSPEFRTSLHDRR